MLRHVPPAAELFLPGCYVNRLLAADEPLDPVTPQVVAELLRFSGKLGINTTKWTAKPLVLPSNQPLVPVRDRHAQATQITSVMATGFPIPDDWEPTDDADAHFIGYQPGWKTPDGRFPGRYWELWSVRAEPAGSTFKWSAGHGGRMTDVERNRGHFENISESFLSSVGYALKTPGDPNSTMSASYWGGTATSIPLLAGMILQEDLEVGRLDHVVGLAVSEANRRFRYPAQRSDGLSTTNPIEEGMRLRLPADHVPSSRHPFVRLLEQGVRDHGFVVWDKSPGYVTLRGEPGLDIGTEAIWTQLATFPWAQLQVLA